MLLDQVAQATSVEKWEKAGADFQVKLTQAEAHANACKKLGSDINDRIAAIAAELS